MGKKPGEPGYEGLTEEESNERFKRARRTGVFSSNDLPGAGADHDFVSGCPSPPPE